MIKGERKPGKPVPVMVVALVAGGMAVQALTGHKAVLLVPAVFFTLLGLALAAMMGPGSASGANWRRRPRD